MADQNITALPVSTTPASSDQLLLVGATEEKLIDYDKLADAILQKLTSKQYTLDQGTKTLPAALNELNSKPLFSNIGDITIDISNTKNNPVELDLPTGTEFLYVSYGIKNASQSYGGATLIIDVKEMKPCFVPVYMDADLKGYLYLYPNPESGKLKIHGINLQGVMLVKVKGR